MKKERKPKQPAGITDEFTASIDSSSVEDIRASIVTMQSQLEEAQTFLKENEQIIDLKEELKLVEGPSRDTVKVLKNRTKYCLERLKERGNL